MRSYYDALAGENGDGASPDQRERNEEDQQISDLVEPLRGRLSNQPNAEEIGYHRQRQQHGRGREIARGELSEREEGDDLYGVQRGEVDRHGADESQFLQSLRQHINQEWRATGIRDRTGEAGHCTPEDA